MSNLLKSSQLSNFVEILPYYPILTDPPFPKIQIFLQKKKIISVRYSKIHFQYIFKRATVRRRERMLFEINVGLENNLCNYFDLLYNYSVMYR